MDVRFVILTAILSNSASGTELLDPASRDEDISSAVIATDIAKIDETRYRYLYTVSNPVEAKGLISNFYIDLYCADGTGSSDVDLGGPGRQFSLSHDGSYVPVELKVLGETAYRAGINTANIARFSLSLRPGQQKQVEVVTTAKPGYRRFNLDVSPYNEGQFNYPYEGEPGFGDPSIPWYEDWAVHGLIKGPACSGSAATPMTRPIFDGQLMPAEYRDTNKILSYEIPGNRNRFHVPATQTSLKLRIYYRYSLDATTFKATLNGRDIRSLFHPENGNEYVALPLEGPRTLIELSGCTREGKDELGQCQPEYLDIDPLEIRRPTP